jgi:hypothetical protein
MTGSLEDEVRALIVAAMPEEHHKHGFDELLDPVVTFGLGQSGDAMKVARYALRLAIGSARAVALLAAKLDETEK